jgi:hypothetical protein
MAVESVQRAAADWTCLFVTAGPHKNHKKTAKAKATRTQG